ncbi:MAG: hypothetical protein ACFFAO_07705 [Candidatus Hermodarchaeota archaeon]
MNKKFKIYLLEKKTIQYFPEDKGFSQLFFEERDEIGELGGNITNNSLKLPQSISQQVININVGSDLPHQKEIEVKPLIESFLNKFYLKKADIFWVLLGSAISIYLFFFGTLLIIPCIYIGAFLLSLGIVLFLLDKKRYSFIVKLGYNLLIIGVYIFLLNLVSHKLYKIISIIFS